MLSNLPLTRQARTQEMNEFFKKLAFTYCLFLIKPIDGDFSYSTLEEHFDSVIEFLLYTDNSAYLFTTIMDFLF